VAKEFPDLDLICLCEDPGMPAVDKIAGTFFVNAAAVCLERQHGQGVCLTVKGLAERRYSLHWPPSNDQQRRTHADEQDATEHGACALALVLSRELTDYKAVRQARKGTGFDYWLGNDDPDLFCARLEISGILQGDDTEIKRRVAQKKKQTKRSSGTGLPAYACVVEFGRPEAQFVQA
jgi:hypothetical protein